MKTSEILREAYERLTPERWFQGSYGRPAGAGPGYRQELDGHGGVCAGLAIGYTVTDDACRALIAANDLPSVDASLTALAMLPDRAAIVAWNNHPDTTFQDVKLGFKRAIAWAEERGD